MTPLKHIIIFHYHFLPGGVTDVVISAIQSWLKYSPDVDRITLVSGRSTNLDKVEDNIKIHLTKEEKQRIELTLFKEIDYIENVDSAVTAGQIKIKLLKRFGGEDKIWWIHNYHLGKNPLFTSSLLDISRETDQKIIFQIHDFPECSRYELLQRLKNTIPGDLYSREKNIRYAVINKRDFNYLKESGLPQNRLFLLENPIKVEDEDSFPPSRETFQKLTDTFASSFPGWLRNEPYMLYPVRTIRRKNVAEAALLAQLAEKNVIVTLPGVSHLEKSYSHKIAELFTDSPVPGLFGIGSDLKKAEITFRELIASSSLIISTSIQEGFGYLFLNSMNWGKPLIARDLDILQSFKPSFKNYKADFYTNLNIPVDVLNIPHIKGLYEKKIQRLSPYITKSTRNNLLQEVDQYLSGHSLDFSLLPLNEQIETIKKTQQDKSFFNKCLEENNFIINKLKIYMVSDCSHRKSTLKKIWGYKSYSRETDKILISFKDFIPQMEHMDSKKIIYESMMKKFASLTYLRLLYDE